MIQRSLVTKKLRVTTIKETSLEKEEKEERTIPIKGKKFRGARKERNKRLFKKKILPIYCQNEIRNINSNMRKPFIGGCENMVKCFDLSVISVLMPL